jgi:hypothetical protein
VKTWRGNPVSPQQPNKARGKHIFLAIADALNMVRPAGAPVDPKQVEQHAKDCRAVANAFASENRAFDRERFLRDCGIQ